MCYRAIYWSKRETLEVNCRNILHSGKNKITITGPLLEEEGLKVHSGFWK